jgi:hypothetical protein
LIGNITLEYKKSNIGTIKSIIKVVLKQIYGIIIVKVNFYTANPIYKKGSFIL